MGGNLKSANKMNTSITTQQIFEAKQILTLDVAQELIGKKIATTSPEYKSNREDVRIGTILSIESEWDLASKNIDAKNFPQGNQQLYWASYFSEDRIKESKSRLKLISEKESPLYGTYNESDGYFFGSDSDRPVFYIVIDEN